jgi:hypothetical protein
MRLAIVKCASSFENPGPQLGYGVANFNCTVLIPDSIDTPIIPNPTNWMYVAPNPFDGIIKLYATPVAEEAYDFQLFDMAGRQVFSIQKTLYKGYNPPLAFSVADLPLGLYLLKATSASQSIFFRLQRK